MTNEEMNADLLYDMFGYLDLTYIPDFLLEELQELYMMDEEDLLHPWLTAPLPSPMSEQTANCILVPCAEHEIPGAFIRIVQRCSEEEYVNYDLRGSLLVQVDRAVDILARCILPEQNQRTGGLFLSTLFRPQLHDYSRLSEAARYAACCVPDGPAVPELDPLRACLRYGLLDALCYKDYARPEPLTLKVDWKHIELSIPCPLPRGSRPHGWSPEALAQVLLRHAIPSFCNAPLVGRLFCTGLMADQDNFFEGMTNLWDCFGYATVDRRLEGDNLTFRLPCTREPQVL